MKRTTNIAFVLVFAVVLAGSIVRMTGSGMGCPDWPKCFGLLIPPTSIEQVLWAPDTEYSKGQIVIERDTLWKATSDHISTGTQLSIANWEPYTKHDYAEFNVAHTWTEYLNRMIGALSGIPVLLLFILAIRSRRTIPILLASGTLATILFVSWLGKLVVDGNLIPFSITIHGVSALAILMFIIGMMQHLDGRRFQISGKLRLLIALSFIIAFSQLILGTQVREQIDIFVKAGVARADLLDAIPSWWKIHRSSVWVLLGLHALWAVPLLSHHSLRRYSLSALAILVAITLTGAVITQLGFPAYIQPAHILLGFGLILIDFRILIATKR